MGRGQESEEGGDGEGAGSKAPRYKIGTVLKPPGTNLPKLASCSYTCFPKSSSSPSIVLLPQTYAPQIRPFEQDTGSKMYLDDRKDDGNESGTVEIDDDIDFDGDKR